MIDKNDVKMPIYKAIDADIVPKVENLLDMLGEVDNKQELRLKSDYYSKFHWFGGNQNVSSDKSYFSYQEEAVYDFIFNLNKSGILSDQVGMGKTIEAGMIISELASRNELRSLLIIVPNEIMAEKWEYELENKFGIKAFTHRVNGVDEQYPKVTAIKNYDDFCRCVFTCIADEKFVGLEDYEFEHTYKINTDAGETPEKAVKEYVESDIREIVNIINQGLEIHEMNIEVVFDGSKFSIKGTKFQRAYKYDKSGEIEKLLSSRQVQRMFSGNAGQSILKKQYERIIKQELVELYTLVGEYFATLPEEISAISESMTQNNMYPFLVIPISYSKRDGGRVVHEEFLNRVLLPEMKDYKHKYLVHNSDGDIDEIFDDYKVVDFFIDAGYQTLIVDEVHDYIDVAAKVEQMKFHSNDKQYGYGKYPSKEYNRYELFDDYYFIKKSSLYKKLKSLADKANRKIFLTATPIKSDMVDFYLLTLLASNKDSDAYRKISANLDSAFPMLDEREAAIENVYNSFKSCVETVAAKHFCAYSSTFLAPEQATQNSADKEKRYKYPYFDNSFLQRHLNNAELIKEYLLGQLSYMSVEEVVLELILAYNAESYADSKTAGKGISEIFDALNELLLIEDGDFLQTRVVFRTLFDNSIKIRFEKDFTNANGNPIKRIRELLEYDEGARKWNRTYRKYGIRHTRHQTYNLAECPELQKLSETRIARYQNLPIWPKRDGKIIFLVRDDIFFDCFLNVKRELKTDEASQIHMEDLPNYDRLRGSEEEKQERFESSLAIFDYINNAMSGGIEGTHEPSASKYESVDLDDSGMVDYKLALINKLMTGHDPKLGSVSRKVLLFAENGREEITEWFKYQKCQPLYDGSPLDPAKADEYEKKWLSYTVDRLGDDWKVSEDAEDLSRYDGNLLIIIDPKRYEKGVDLQKADTIINFDINYCPLKMEQRIGRIDRIRPSGNVSTINIISFVPMNDMSGYVINFFANELKMFTQWMGETTGIVSVPEDSGDANSGEDVSFEGKVYNLERYYHYIYDLCKQKISNERAEKMAFDFAKRFGVNEDKTIVDFKMLVHLREQFDMAFRNSVSTHRTGYEVPGGARVMRFNSVLGPFADCAAERCENCSNRSLCAAKNKPVRNSYNMFRAAVESFFKEGENFYRSIDREYNQKIGSAGIMGQRLESYKQIVAFSKSRIDEFRAKGDAVRKLLPTRNSAEPFTMPFEKYDEIMSTMKRLYWDQIVEFYIGQIIAQFHNQCDSVLKGARLFEKFVKTLSIADFMNNMEGTV